jgi:hypothetical protein
VRSASPHSGSTTAWAVFDGSWELTRSGKAVILSAAKEPSARCRPIVSRWILHFVQDDKPGLFISIEAKNPKRQPQASGKKFTETIYLQSLI